MVVVNVLIFVVRMFCVFVFVVVIVEILYLDVKLSVCFLKMSLGLFRMYCVSVCLLVYVKV